MQLLELLTSTYPFELTKGRYGWDGTFKTKDGHDVNLVMASSTEWPGVMEVEFNRPVKGAEAHAINNKGDAFKIFATVIAMMKQVVTKERPDYIYFLADKKEQSRIDLYQAMCKRAEKDGFKRVNMHKVLKDPEADETLLALAKDFAIDNEEIGQYMPDGFFVLDPN